MKPGISVGNVRIEIIEEKSKKKYQIEVPNEGKTLLSIFQMNGIYVDAPCGGNGTCGRCRVKLPEDGICLACRFIPEEDCQVVILDSGTAEMETLAAGNPVGREKMTPDIGQVNAYGVAIDIGTTTLAASLLNLTTGEECAASVSVNHQRAYGADVIARIQKANEGMGEQLRACICSDLENLLEDLVRQAGISRYQVKKAAIAANVTMCHLLRGLSCAGLGVAPYTPVDLKLWEGSWMELMSAGRKQEGAFGEAKVMIFPGISAFVGGDIVAGIYACGLDERAEAGFLIDIGTNGEMAVGNRDGFLVTSAAAGPVFEGGNISCGVPGIPGAMTHLTLEHRQQRSPGSAKAALSCSYETIAGKPPIGLCGTGIMDAVSELVRLGLVDENGTLTEPWFETGVPVAGDAVRFMQEDIREVQMGKSAIRAGIETLLSEYGKGTALDVCLAGGFGYAMNTAGAIRIGLFPESFAGKIRPVGNSALEGAKRFLRADEQEAGARLERIVRRSKEISLALHPKFNELYLQHMFFGDGRT